MEERIQEQYEEIDLREIFALLKANVVYILIATLAFAIVGFIGNKFLITPQYESSVNMIVNTKQDNSSNVSSDNISSAKSLVDTYAIIIKSNTVLYEVIDELNLDMSYEELSQKISVSDVNATQIMQISVTDPDPNVAADIVRSIAEISPDEIVDAVEAGSCKVISQVETTDEPVSPSVLKNTALAGIIGLVLAVAIIVIKDFLANYIVDDDDVQKYLGLPVLGVIPEVEEA